MFLSEKERAEKLVKEVMDFPLAWPDILIGIASGMKQYRDACRKQNDWRIREALGDAVHLLGMDKRPPKNVMKLHAGRIKNVVYPQGIDTPNLHEGERRFWRKYFGEEKNQC